jgi:sodium/proline symporter
MIVSFIAFLSLFILIGLATLKQSRNNKQDYYLASQSISPWLAGLSAVATNNSGYMFIGVIGYTYHTGLAAVWLMIGWIAGDFLSSLFIHTKLRTRCNQTGEVSYAGVLSNWHGKAMPTLQRLIGLIALVFLTAYAAAQLVAGSKALHVLFNWPIWSGAVIGAIMVCVYCFAGGIRASIWTDAAQSVVMITAMGFMLWAGTMETGGPMAAIQAMQNIEGYLNWIPSNLAISGLSGLTLFLVGWLFAGFSVIGQPHVMIRFMTLGHSDQVNKAKTWYYLWFVLFYLMATGVGLLSRIYLTQSSSFDAELALPTMALQLLPPFWVGLVLAGIFAATMSTADSLVLSCSAAITHDLLPHRIEKPILIKATTVLVTLFAMGLALLNHQSVFNLVLLSWSGLASAFAPLLIMLCLNFQPSEKTALISATAGFTVALAWRYFNLQHYVYEGMPGILTGLLILSLAHFLTPCKNNSCHDKS